MLRRDFITRLGAAAAALPLAARAQETRKLYRVGFLGDSPAVFADAIEAFRRELRDLGWSEGRNIAIEYRWAEGRLERMHELAEELVRLKVDIIVVPSSIYTEVAKRATSTIPIIFMSHAGPIESGHVDSLSRPGGNTTGFTQFEYSLSGKWLELLKQIAPQVTRVAVIRDPVNGSGIAQFAVIQAFAPPLGVELTPIDARDLGEIDRGITAFARFGSGGLIVTSGGTGYHRDVIIPLAARLRLPAPREPAFQHPWAGESVRSGRKNSRCDTMRRFPRRSGTLPERRSAGRYRRSPAECHGPYR